MQRAPRPSALQDALKGILAGRKEKLDKAEDFADVKNPMGEQEENSEA